MTNEESKHIVTRKKYKVKYLKEVVEEIEAENGFDALKQAEKNCPEGCTIEDVYPKPKDNDDE